MKWLKIIVLSAIGFLSLQATLASVWAQPEQDEALKGRKQGELIPYGQIARQIERQFEGRIVGQNLNKNSGRWVYNLRVLRDRDSLVIFVVVDAKTGQIIRSRGR